jgi:two-component system cell cycle response regulator
LPWRTTAVGFAGDAGQRSKTIFAVSRRHERRCGAAERGALMVTKPPLALNTPILVAEDERVTRHFLDATLRGWGYTVTLARDGTEAWNALTHESGPSLAILDWMMPGMDGPEICRRLRARHDRYVYVLLLSGRNQKDDVVIGLESGADDYIVKPFATEELHARLRSGARILDLEGKLRMRATRDPLTGLWTRSAILDQLDRELERARRTNTAAVGVMMADIDSFKGINDQYGHAAGDLVLTEAARRIRSALRPYDSVGRVGGEEFLVLLPDCDSTIAHAVAERVRASIASEPFHLEDVALTVTVSVGVTVNRQAPEANGAWLMRRADHALYEAKAKGRNRVAGSTFPPR